MTIQYKDGDKLPVVYVFNKLNGTMSRIKDMTIVRRVKGPTLATKGHKVWTLEGREPDAFLDFEECKTHAMKYLQSKVSWHNLQADNNRKRIAELAALTTETVAKR